MNRVPRFIDDMHGGSSICIYKYICIDIHMGTRFEAEKYMREERIQVNVTSTLITTFWWNILNAGMNIHTAARVI